MSPTARLALAYAPRAVRPEWLAYLALDERLGRIVRDAREPLMAQIRLAWWRERLGEPVEGWPKGEPLLEALREWRDQSCLSVLPDAWEPLLATNLTDTELEGLVAARVQSCLCLVRELGDEQAGAAPEHAARVWAIAYYAELAKDAAERRRWVGQGASQPPLSRLPASLRPLAVLAALGARSLAHGGGPLLAGPRSLFLALRVGLTGR